MFTKEELKKIADAAQEKRNERFMNECEKMTRNIIEECKGKAEEGYYDWCIKSVNSWGDKKKIIIIENLVNLGYKAYTIPNHPLSKEETLIISWKEEY